MRDPKRIDGILKQLGVVWKQNPDLRLGQLILNVVRDPAAYYIEDDVLIKSMYEFYSREVTHIDPTS
jgi:uncharacterized protein YihD (DUF1040 family)